MNVDSHLLILASLVLCGLGVVLSLLLPARRQGTVLALLGCVAAVAMAWAGANTLWTGKMIAGSLWSLPALGAISYRLDTLSALFLLVTGLVIFPASIFAAGELGREPRRGDRAFAVMLLGLYASIVGILVAGDVLSFLLSWEVMSILCYLLIVCRRDRENGQAEQAYLLLAMGEAGTLACVLGFLFLSAKSGSLDFAQIKLSAHALGGSTRWVVYLLTFFGFGVKAGLVPVNFWLPRSYTAAPRAFVPVLAGATLNLGIYGILRVNADCLPMTDVGAGLITMVIGTLSALVGILYATAENDLKTMLAYSSIENAGIIVTGLGAGMVFVATGHPALAAIALVASLYHMTNHSLYKTLLFFGAGAVESQAGTRDMDRLGGLIRWMPLTALGFLAGTLCIAAMPPLNGFVSEWLTLQTMLRSAELSSVAVKMVFALCGAALALTAALAVTCFAKAFAMSFLGMRRLNIDQPLAEARPGALASMAILALLCLALGVLPTYMIPLLDTVTHPLTGASASTALVPAFFSSHPDHGKLPRAFVGEFHDLGAQVGQRVLPGRGLVVLHRGGTENPVVFAMSTFYLLAVLIVLLAVTYVVIRLCLTRRRRLQRQPCWDGGVRRLLPEMTYTATGFSNPVRVIFDAIFRPTTVEDSRETVAEHFRTAIRREKRRDYLGDKLVLFPVKMVALWVARRLAAMHHGRINAYAAYVLLALLVVLVIVLL
jgi:hydrogenase-4 component B